MSFTIRGGVRPIGITIEKNSYSFASNVFYGGKVSYYTNSLEVGMKYFAKRDGSVVTERKSESGNNYPVGTYTSDYAMAIDLQ